MFLLSRLYCADSDDWQDSERLPALSRGLQRGKGCRIHTSLTGEQIQPSRKCVFISVALMLYLALRKRIQERHQDMNLCTVFPL